MTEKDYNPEQKQNKAMKKHEKAGQSKTKVIENVKNETKEEKITEKKQEIKKEPKKQEKQKKEFAAVRGVSLALSTKISAGVCKFIKGKSISQAIKELEQVGLKKRAVPMKGEFAHRKGKIMAGKYPKKASKYFIELLKSLQANANYNGLEEPVILEAVANIASRPFGKFGRVRRKRTHVLIKAMEKKLWKKKM